LRSFGRPIAIRVLMHPDGTGTLTTKMTDRTGQHGLLLIVNKTEPLPADRVKLFREKIKQLEYWAQPMRDPRPSGYEGARWVLEGVDQGRYRVVDRWSPRNGPVRELGLYFLHALAHLKEEPIY